MTVPKMVDTKSIIVNLLKEDKGEYLSIERLLKLLRFIYNELRERCELENYQISFDINFDAIERTVWYNKTIFELDIDGENIYLREPSNLTFLAQRYKVDDTIQDIIKGFVRAA